MKPVFQAAKRAPKRIIFLEGEDERVLRAVQTVVDEGLCRPVLIGRPDVVIGPASSASACACAPSWTSRWSTGRRPALRRLWGHYHSLMERKGVSVDAAKREGAPPPTLLGALLVKFGYADGMICGTYGMHGLHLKFIETVLGRQKGCATATP